MGTSTRDKSPRIRMPPKSNNQKKKEAEAAGKAPKKTKQQENAGKSASQKKAEMQVGCSSKTAIPIQQYLFTDFRPSALLTRTRRLVDGELTQECRSRGCSIEFVKPIFHGLKYPYPGTKTYFKPPSSGICIRLELCLFFVRTI